MIYWFSNFVGKKGMRMRSKMNQLIEDERNIHVLYAFNGMENYINQILNYIEDGVAAKDHVLLVENERVTRLLQKELATRFSADQLELVHFINSFQFYWSSGSYHPPAILAYFTKTIQPYLEKEQPFRSWAHVEWESVKEPLHIIEDFEKIADDAVNEHAFPLVCAYEKNKMPEHLQTILMETHPYVLMEDSFVVSDQYRPVDAVK